MTSTSRTWSDALAPGHHGTRAPAGDRLDDRNRGRRDPAGRRGNRPCVGTPVIVGTIDAAAEAISVGVLDAGEMMLMYGSTIFTIRIGDERMRDPRLWHAPWLFPDQYACMAGLATSGTLTHWFADQFARDLSPEAAMAALAAEARASPPGANGLVFLPYFSGERTPIHDPNAKGAIVGLTLAHTRADIYRAAPRGYRLRDQPHLRHLRRGWRAAFDDRRGWRGTAQPDLDASHVRCLGAQTGGARGQHRRFLWRRLSRQTCARRRLQISDQAVEPGRIHN